MLPDYAFIKGLQQCKGFVKNQLDKLILMVVLIVCGQLAVCQKLNIPEFEDDVKRIVQQVTPSCVKISGYDTSNNRSTGGSFSGVVISEDGWVLTAAHAASPGRVYQLEFPDGTNCIGIGKGRISTVDAACIQIITPGIWPFSEMGWSYSLKKNQPCLSISYPGSIQSAKVPSVRLGYIAAPLTSANMIQSTCLMEPGDSGGPLFDFFGRVIGIHSRIEVSLEVNLEIPVDHFRKYWTALQQPVSYRRQEPPSEELVGIDPLEGQAALYPGLAVSEKRFLPPIADLASVSVKISNSDTSKQIDAWGTVLNGSSLNQLPAGLVVSKSSLVKENPVIYVNEKQLRATVIHRNDSLDLVLLKAEGLQAVPKLMFDETDSLGTDYRGKFLLSVSPEGNPRVGIFSVDSLDIPMRSGAGFLGVMSQVKDGRLEFLNIVPRSPAEHAQLKQGDCLEGLNGEVVKSTIELSTLLSAFRPGEKVVLSLNRRDSLFDVPVVLGKRPENRRHAADRLEEGKSERRDGFSGVFAHDGAVRPEECGGPVFDTNGRFVGINIARLSRTVTLVMPYSSIAKFAKEAESIYHGPNQRL